MTLPRVLLAVVSLLSALLVSVHFAAPAVAVPLSGTTVITNNIQGGSTSAGKNDKNTDSKWTTQIHNYIQAASIVLVQEAGPSGPPGATLQTPVTTADGDTVQHYLWPTGTTRGVVLAQVYFIQTNDPGNPRAVGGRVNIAIVTRAVPDEVRVVDNPTGAGRTALGVRFGNNWYFSIHGLSRGGNDSGALLAAIANAVATWGTAAGVTYTYTVGGDFNRDPDNLTTPAGTVIRRTFLATHQGDGDTGSELDYFVTDDTTAPGNNQVYRLSGRQGDHYAVQMGGLRAAAEPPPLKIMLTGDPVDPANGTVADSTLFGIDNFLYGGANSSVTFVGDNTSSGGTPEEGTADEEISALAAQDATAISKYRPNVVLLQAGTWDLQNGDGSGAFGRLSSLINQIQASDPSVVMIVATLDPNTNAADEAQVTAFNWSFPYGLDAKAAAGQRVVLADMNTESDADLNADGVTLNATGQQIAASTYDGAMAYAVEMGWISPPQPASAPSGSVCDIYVFYGTPCVAAYSMTRALYSDYDGPLYRVTRALDGRTADIGLLSAGGDVNAAAQDSFCTGTTCTVTTLYDQSPEWNDLSIAPAGGAVPTADNGANATALPITVGGHKAYGLDITPGTGYRENYTDGIATGGEPEGMYMVASGTNVNDQCCFDFGNAETNSQDNGNGHMDAVNFGTKCYYSPCTGGGPWVAADMENGLFQGGNGSNTANAGDSSDFVTAMLKNDGQTTYALKGGNAQSGGLATWWNGSLPTNVPGYKPMQQEGAIILGTGGDNSNGGTGSFFEGVMTHGYPSDAADLAVQANIVAAGYAGNSGGASAAPSAAGQAVVHGGYSSVYTVDSASGHLDESYLSAMGDPWVAQDLSDKYNTPPVMAGTNPVAVVHDGYTSVYTVDAGDSTHAAGDLQETYLSAVGQSWITQDLSATGGTLAGTPKTSWTPTAVYHNGYTSVYTVDTGDGTHAPGDLQETYLPAIGDKWSTQDLSVNYQAPSVLAGTSPVAILHSGYTSVYTVDATNDHLQETYLPSVGFPGDSWVTQDLTKGYQTPPTTVTPTAVVHGGYTSVYTVDASNQHLQETYLPAIGDNWVSQDLSATGGTLPGTPPVAPGTQPVALFHTGYTSVYTVDQGSDDVQETYLANVGASWATQDFTAKYHTPTTADTPIVLLHPDASGNLSWTSVYTIGEFDSRLEETYLPAIGDQWTTQDLSDEYGTPAVAVGESPTAGLAVVHGGYTSVYTTKSSNGDLLEVYLSAMGQQWVVQDLSAKYHTPAVLGGTTPVAVVHDGYTSVYTVDAGDSTHASGDLQETYLSAVGQSWITQDLSATGGTLAGTPRTTVTPTAVYHNGYTSVYTIDTGDSTHPKGDLQETYLSAIGQSWITQDLSANYGTPPAAVRTAPVALMHSGWTSVYTVDAGGDLQETYLPTIGARWGTLDLSQNDGHTPKTSVTPSAITHNGYTSVYTVDTGDSTHASGDLQETYLPAIGDQWATQDLSKTYRTPTVELGAVPEALYHTGYTSVYTIDAATATSALGDVQETYLPAIGDNWITQDLSGEYQTPAAPAGSMAAVLHPNAIGALTWTSIFTDNLSNGDLQETYLPTIGDKWTTQDLAPQ